LSATTKVASSRRLHARRLSARALLVVAVAACARGETRAIPDSSASAVISVVDDGGQTVRLPRAARRVVSLIPSATETIVALGGVDQLVARTRYDVMPEVAHLPSVGATIEPDLEAIAALRPDLAITWHRVERRRTRTQLEALGVPTFALSVQDTADVFEMIARIGTMLGRDSNALALSSSIRRDLGDIRRSVAGRPSPTVFFVVWNDPPMTAGPETFISQVIGVAGGRILFGDLSGNWPNVGVEEVLRRQPDAIVLPTGEMRPTTLQQLRALPGWRSMRAVRDGHVLTLPADLTNRPGPRIAVVAKMLRDSLERVRASLAARPEALR
jgi:iron complex transport system substrate-binding protein